MVEAVSAITGGEFDGGASLPPYEIEGDCAQRCVLAKFAAALNLMNKDVKLICKTSPDSDGSCRVKF